MKTSGIDTKRILLMTALGACLLGAVVVAPSLRHAVEERRARLDDAQSQRVAHYRQRLTPCTDELAQRNTATLPLTADDVLIEISPTFSPTQGVIVSADSVRGYQGVSAFNLPAPPPGIPYSTSPDPSEIALTPPTPLGPALGRRVLQTLKTEIDHADTPTAYGFDGVSYLLLHGDQCARTWTPQPGARAYTLALLADGLGELSHQTGEEARVTKTNIRNLLIELDADRLQLER
ncbi:hypothetical protein [Xanthomonas sp. 3498]|uniref:hypothetical protein n=1 Tax=Xanthomonas sp. 3498 TaxID=2663863 RepID=UPI001614BD0D|nr:hypothetical protein [Xanthomonas sp. 3498]MBB5878358.1 hypothetical protein [Xanthomonas sp. 3498]